MHSKKLLIFACLISHFTFGDQIKVTSYPWETSNSEKGKYAELTKSADELYTALSQKNWGEVSKFIEDKQLFKDKIFFDPILNKRKFGDNIYLLPLESGVNSIKNCLKWPKTWFLLCGFCSSRFIFKVLTSTVQRFECMDFVANVGRPLLDCRLAGQAQGGPVLGTA